MSLYTSAVKTHVIDPVRDIDGKRTEFRLPDGDHAYLANMRLMNLGLILNAGPRAYNTLVGTYGIIRQIVLYDGSRVLDSVLAAPQLMGFKLYNKSNDQSRDQTKYLALNNLGFHTAGVDFGGQVQIAQYRDPLGADEGTEASPTGRGWLSLRAVFPFLAESEYVPSNVFKNLRLVVEYDLTNPGALPNPSGSTIENQTEPILVVDEIVDPALSMDIMTSYRGVNYRSLEHDRVIVPAATPTVGNPTPTQTVNFNINGFDNKTVKRMLMVKTPRRDIKNALTGGYESVAQRGERHLWRVNGANKQARNGWDRPNQRLAYLCDTWGECNAPVVGNVTGVDDSGNVVTNNVAALVGNLDYNGIVIGDRVRELQLTYERINEYDAAAPGGSQAETLYNQELELNFYGEVEKALEVNGETYNVRYV